MKMETVVTDFEREASVRRRAGHFSGFVYPTIKQKYRKTRAVPLQA